MGYYTDLLNKINQIEAHGFNPYTDSLEGRVAQLSTVSDTNIPQAENNGLQTVSEPISQPQDNVTDPTQVSNNITTSFTRAGYDDPFINIVDDAGAINLSTLSAGYNLLQDDPNIGITKDQYIDFVNKTYPEALSKRYYKGAQMKQGPAGSFVFEKEEADELKDVEPRFEKQWSPSQKKYLYLDTRGSEKTGKAYKEYKDEDEFRAAIGKYEQSKNG